MTSVPHDRGPSFAAGALVGLATLLCLRPLESTGFWSHLSAARAVRQGTPGGDSWLHDAAALALWESGGVAAILLATAALAGVTTLLCLRLAQDLVGPARGWAAVLLGTLVVGATSSAFRPGPASFALALLAASAVLACRARGATGRARIAYLGALLVVVAVWSQVDSSAALAPAVIVALALPTGRAEPPWSTAGLVLLTAAAALPLVGAVGLGALAAPFGSAWPAPNAPPMYLFGVLLIGAVGASRGGAAPGHLLLAAAGLALTRAGLGVPAATVLALPLAAAALRDAPAWIEDGSGRRVAAASVALVPLILGWGGGGPSLRWDRTSVPADATGAMAALDVSGPFLADAAAAPWVEWAAGSATADTRAERDVARFRELDGAFYFGTVLTLREQPLCDALHDDADWKAVWFGERRALFVRRTRIPRIQGIEHLAPCTSESSVGRCLRADEPERFFDELEVIRGLDPSHGYLDRLGVALALYCVGDASRAAEQLSEAARFDPTHPDLRRFTGAIHLGLGRIESALAPLEAASPDDGAAIDLRLQALRELDRPAEALPLARARVADLGDATPSGVRAVLAWACADAGDVGCVLAQSTRAALQGDAESLARLVELEHDGLLPESHEALVGALLANRVE